MERSITITLTEKGRRKWGAVSDLPDSPAVNGKSPKKALKKLAKRLPKAKAVPYTPMTEIEFQVEPQRLYPSVGEDEALPSAS